MLQYGKITIFFLYLLIVSKSLIYNQRSFKYNSNFQLQAKRGKSQTDNLTNARKGFGKVTENKIAIFNSTNPLAASILDSSAVDKKDYKPNEIKFNSNVDDVYKKYGISDKSKDINENKAKKRENDGDEASFGASIMESISLTDQGKIDKTLVTLTFGSLSIVVITGLSISFGAFKLVYPNVQIDSNIENTIINVLAPAFSPSTAVFFLFSVTYGLFKFAQISSGQTVYKE